MKVQEESEKVGLKLNIQKTKIVASGPIPSWQIDGETMETVRDFIFLDSKTTAEGECSHKIKRCLLKRFLSQLGRKAVTNLNRIFKRRDITLLTKVCLVKVMIFPVVLYGCESWTIKTAENWCFPTVVLEETAEIPLDCKGIKQVNPKWNQPWIVIGRTDAEVPILWPPDAKNQLIGNECDAGKYRTQEEKGGQGQMMK